jgi:hypothetical protein
VRSWRTTSRSTSTALADSDERGPDRSPNTAPTQYDLLRPVALRALGQLVIVGHGVWVARIPGGAYCISCRRRRYPFAGCSSRNTSSPPGTRYCSGHSWGYRCFRWSRDKSTHQDIALALADRRRCTIQNCRPDISSANPETCRAIRLGRRKCRTDRRSRHTVRPRCRR